MQRLPNPRCRDVHRIGFTMLHNFRIAACDRDSGSARGVSHGAYFGFEHGRGQPGFEHISDDHRLCFGSRNREIIYGAVDRKLSDGAAGKSQRLDYETVRGDGDLGAIEIQMGRISEWFRRRRKKQRSKKTFYESAAGFTSGSVRHLDLRLAEANSWRTIGGSFYATDAML